MKKKFSKILSVIIALAMICSMTVIAPMTVIAETSTEWQTVWSQNFNNLAQNDDGTYTLGSGTNTTALEIDPTTVGSDSYANTRHTYLTTVGDGDYAFTLTHTSDSSAIIPIDGLESGNKYKLTYDWQTNCSSDSGCFSRVWYRNDKGDGTNDYYQVSGYEGKLYVSGGNWGNALELNTWYKVEVILDFIYSTMSATVYNNDGSVFATFSDIYMQGLTYQMEMYSNNGGAMIDNIVIAKEVEVEIDPNLVWSQDFNNLPQNDDGTYTLGGDNTSTLEIDPETVGSDSYANTRHTYLTAVGDGDYALTLTHTAWSEGRIPVNLTFDGTSTYKFEYDWYTTATTGDSDVSRVRFNTDNGYSQISGYQGKAYFTNSTDGAERSVATPTNQWIKVEALFNSATKAMDITWYLADGTTYLTQSCSNWGMSTLNTIELNGAAGGSMLDNFKITKVVSEDSGDDEEEELPANTVWSENFDAGTANLGGSNTTELEINPAIKGTDSGATGSSRWAYYSTNGSGYALSLTHTAWSEANIPVGAAVPATAGQGVYKLTYDWMTTCGQGDGEYSAVMFLNGSDYYAAGARALYPSSFSHSYAPEALTTYSKLSPSTWYDVEVVFDFAAATADYTLSLNGTVVYTLEDQDISGLTSLTALGMYGPAGGQSIDNIVLTCEDEGTTGGDDEVSGLEEVVFEMNFDDTPTNLGGMNTTAMEANPTTKGSESYPATRHAYYETSGTGYAFRLTHTGWSEAKIAIDASIPEKTGTGKYKVTYDWKPYCGSGESERGLITVGGVEIGAWSKYPYIAGEKASTQLTVQKLYKVEAVYDFAANTADVTIYDSTGAVVFSKTGAACSDYITELYLLGVADGMYLDNFVVSRIYDGTEAPEVKAKKVVIMDVNDEEQSDWTAVSPYTDSVEISFGAVMNQSTLTSDNIYILDKAANTVVSAAVTPAVAKATVTLNDGVSLEAGKTYIIFVGSGVAADNGMTVGKNYTFEFTVDTMRKIAEATSVKVNGNAVTSFTDLKAASSATIEIDYENTTMADVTFYVVVGYYSEANELVKHDIYKVDKSSDVYTEAISLPFTVSAPSSAVRAKVMTWNSFELNKPLGKGLSIAD